jgi:hypothetical protein
MRSHPRFLPKNQTFASSRYTHESPDPRQLQRHFVGPRHDCIIKSLSYDCDMGLGMTLSTLQQGGGFNSLEVSSASCSGRPGSGSQTRTRTVCLGACGIDAGNKIRTMLLPSSGGIFVSSKVSSHNT